MRLYKGLWPQVQHLKAFWGLQDLIPMSLLHKASIWSWLLKGGSSPLLLWFLHKFPDDLMTWQLASPRAQDSKEMKKQSFLWASLGTHCYICPIFYSREGSHWVSHTFKGKELGSAFGRNKHERICKHILKTTIWCSCNFCCCYCTVTKFVLCYPLLPPSVFPSLRVFSSLVAKVLELQLQDQSFQRIFRVDFLRIDLL